MAVKLSQPVDVSLAEGFLFEAWWNYRLAGDIWIHREDPAQGHFVLINAIKPLLSALFIANGEYVPHEKWLVHMSRTLDWKPERWEEGLREAFSTGHFDLGSLAARQQAIDRLWRAIDARLREKTGTKVSMMQKYFYDKLKVLVEKGSLPVQEWAGEDAVGLLSSQPFHGVVELIDGVVVLDPEKLLALQPQHMYSWFYEVVEAVIGEDGVIDG